MKDKSINALVVTSQALSITSQLLAIGIEIGIITGGYFLYKKIKKELIYEEKTPVIEQKSISEKNNLKQKFGKVKKIFKAIID